jgi:hypothetical protein
MMDDVTDPPSEKVLDGNATAGVLRDLFGAEMTAMPCQCASCGNVAESGTLRAWMAGPGVVLRCSVCQEVVLRVVEAPDARYLDARGAACLRLPR